MKTVTAFAALFCLVLLSCNQEPSMTPKTEMQIITSEIINSDSYSELGIQGSSLAIDRAQYVNSDKKSVFIPFKGHDEGKGILGLFTDQGKLRTVGYYEAVTKVPADRIYEELNSGKFVGAFIFQYEGVKVEIAMENSRIVSSKGVNMRSVSGRVVACRDWDGYGGVLWCAGRRLEEMNWFDAALCYAQFVTCMAVNVISCGIDGCAVM